MTALDARQVELVALFQRRLGIITRSFRSGREQIAGRLTFNESLAAAKQALNPRARRKPARRRFDLTFELLVNVRALEFARRRDPGADYPSGVDVRGAGRALIAEFKPRRGRPADAHLELHVHAMMALYRQSSGLPLRAGLTRDSVYEPGLRSEAGEAMLGIFQKVDPKITMTQLANIVIDAHQSSAVEGKRFEDFFPFAGPPTDPATGVPATVPGYTVERFIPIAPIYSS